MLIERIKSCVALSSEYEEESLHYSAQFTVCSTNDGGFGDTFGRHLATLDSGPRLMLDDSRSARAKVKYCVSKSAPESADRYLVAVFNSPERRDAVFNNIRAFIPFNAEMIFGLFLSQKEKT